MNSDDASPSSVLGAEETILKLAEEMERAQVNADDFAAMRLKLEEAQIAFQEASTALEAIHGQLTETAQAAQGALHTVSEASQEAFREAIQQLQETGQRVQAIERQVQESSRAMQQAITRGAEQVLGALENQSQRLIAALNEQAQTQEMRMQRLAGTVRWAVVLAGLAMAGSVAGVVLLLLGKG